VFILVFAYFKVEPRYQHRVLFWGIIGAVVMRAVFIVVGVSVIARFHWILDIFGAFPRLHGRQDGPAEQGGRGRPRAQLCRCDSSDSSTRSPRTTIAAISSPATRAAAWPHRCSSCSS